MAKAKIIDVNRKENYINRELSWLDFNFRILGEAKDTKNLLFERMKFLMIATAVLSSQSS